MSLRLRRFWNNIQGSLWFVPSVIMLSLMCLAFLMAWLDNYIGYQRASQLHLVLQGGPSGIRDMLASIAGSLLTVASVAFSFTIVVFSFASGQYASRTLHKFMDDNTNQVVLGMLLGSFVYCLLVLRTVRLEENDEFVPVISANIALLLAIVDLGLFILFIHHVSESIQAYHIISRVGRATSDSINLSFPNRAEMGLSEAETEALIARYPMHEVAAARSGYLQAVDMDYLQHIARRHDLLIVMQKGVGRYVATEEVLGTVGPVSRVTPKVDAEVRRAFVLGYHRTIFQDPQYGVLQLSDIAIKALSPAINDPNTAIMALNEISRVMRQLAGHKMERTVLRDDRGNPRVIAQGPTFASVASQAFDQIRRFAMSDAAIPMKMLDVLAEVTEKTDLDQQREVLRDHARAVIEEAGHTLTSERDRALLNERIPLLGRALGLSTDDLALPPRRA